VKKDAENIFHVFFIAAAHFNRLPFRETNLNFAGMRAETKHQ